MTTAVDIRGVTKIYSPDSNQAVKALDNVSLTINDNEFFTLLGPSGCGKTTLLRLIAGFEQVSGGEIMLFDEEIENLEPNRRPVNTVFQHYALFPHMTIANNVAFGLERLKKPKPEIKATVERVLTLVKMKELGDRRPNQLSGGQQQRVALARALAPSPKVLLLDEPLSALDLKLRQAMREELKQLQRETGITFVFVTHDQEEALIMSDRIAVMLDGKIAQLASPQELYSRPVSKWVASFIGVMNFLQGDLFRDGGDKLSVDAGILGKISLNQEQIPVPVATGPVTIGIRPEMLTVLYDKNSTAEFELNAVIMESDYYGDMTYYTVKVEQSELVLIVSMRNTAGRTVLKEGDKARIGWGSESLVILAESTSSE